MTKGLRVRVAETPDSGNVERSLSKGDYSAVTNPMRADWIAAVQSEVVTEAENDAAVDAVIGAFDVVVSDANDSVLRRHPTVPECETDVDSAEACRRQQRRSCTNCAEVQKGLSSRDYGRSVNSLRFRRPNWERSPIADVDFSVA